MFSEKLTAYAGAAFQASLPAFGPEGRKITEKLGEFSGDMRVCMELVCGTLPMSDVVIAYDQVLEGYCRHGLRLREESPFCRDVPEDIFIHYVLYPRVNSEDLVDCRWFFYEKLCHVTKLPPERAALAVNQWCAGQMTYETSDNRSENPMTAYFSGLGRCGEESTFAVTAFRSVGIPARQVYVPWWSHCDDNHAWVEVYLEGRWHFLGACEPEPILDRGWFSDAASRAMLVCSRNFFGYVGDGLRREALTQRQGNCFLYNQTPRYAKTARLVLRIVDEAGRPASGVWVRFFVLNMAAMRQFAQLETDGQGQACLECGLGSLRVEVRWGEGYCRRDITLAGDTVLRLTMGSFSDPEREQLDFLAPEATAINKTTLTAAQQTEKTAVLTRAEVERRQRVDAYWSPVYMTGDAGLDKVFRMAGGHAGALWEFYQEQTDQLLAKGLLLSLATKDWRDVDTAVLREALSDSAPYRELPVELYLPYVLCPRIWFEPLRPWRQEIRRAFTPEQLAGFGADPEGLWRYLREKFPEGTCRYYPVLSVTPDAALKAGFTDEKGRKLLFVAILRTAGIPARIDPVDGSPQFWRDGQFCSPEARAETEACGEIRLLGAENLTYGVNFGLARLENGRWLALEYEAGAVCLPALAGVYRLIVTNRLPNGNQLASSTVFTLERGEKKRLSIIPREAELEQMLANSQLDPFSFSDEKGNTLTLRAADGKKLLLIYAQVGMEPTEHIFNELLAAGERLSEKLELVIALRGKGDLENATLQRVLREIPRARVVFDDFSGAQAASTARRMYLEPGLWPMLILTDASLRGYYGHAGYAVGAVDLALRLAEAAGK